EFDRLYDFLAQVVAVGFGHDRNGSKSGRTFLFYVLTLMATAIPSCPAIYFVLAEERILYIGQTLNLS
nr:hypothetical protein [Scytonema hyalinum WJT4-NPBG1]